MITLYGFWRSSCTWRVRIALHLKNVEHQTIPVCLSQGDGEQHAPEFAAINPSRQVPTLVVPSRNGQTAVTHTLSQSMAILWWLDRNYPMPQLFPSVPLKLAHCIELAEIINAGIQPLQNIATRKLIAEHGIDVDTWCKDAITRGLLAFEKRIEASKGEFCLGDSVSAADLFLIPQLYNARLFGVDLGALPRLCAIEQACEQVPAFAKARPEIQPDAP